MAADLEGFTTGALMGAPPAVRAGERERVDETRRDTAGDESLEAFCRRMRPRLLGALTLYCGERHVAEELAQETLARVWAHWSTVRSAPNPEAWTHRVGLNLAASHYRRRAAERRARGRLGHEVDAPPVDPADMLAVRQAVARLPRGQRTAIILRYYLDLPVAETAAVMGCSEGNVKSQTARGIATLKADGGLTPERQVRGA